MGGKREKGAFRKQLPMAIRLVVAEALSESWYVSLAVKAFPVIRRMRPLQRTRNARLPDGNLPDWNPHSENRFRISCETQDMFIKETTSHVFLSDEAR